MADAIAEATAKLVLDDVTGEMISKNELKKRTQKRAKKAATEKARAAAATAPQDSNKQNAPKPKAKQEESIVDPDAIFKLGFLDDVFKERPMKPVVTRFPPEPNGFLHIGHAKAICINFGFAKYHGGETYLRMDDTNPEAEEERYFVAIEEMVRWLGFTPRAVTYSSDNFQKLYDLAEKLIEVEKAYVCHCNDEEIKAQRGGENHGPRFRCSHAEQSVETNLAEFRGMRDGKYKPREAFLRMKQDIEDGNPVLKSEFTNLCSESTADYTYHTFQSIKRRGVPPGAIVEFVSELGVTTAPSVIQISRFEQTVRRYLERTVPRLMLVLDPVPVVIEDAEEIEVDVPFSPKNCPKNPEMGSHKVKFTPTVYIDRSDFREVDSKDYFRLAPNKTVGLLQAPYPIKAVSFTKDETTGQVTEIRAVFDKETKKPKTFIQWVPSGSREVEVRIHNSLFKSEKPDDAEGGYLNDLNPESEVIYAKAMIESGFDEVRARAPWPEAAGESELGKGGLESVRFQGMRVAYFAMDPVDSTDSKAW
ncbi:hypothetical protein ONZ43_g1713 [Nemania bipapillata]|uniref:Uncharacterized protein n=1 Tax=Nemania bipapillata TaxID=110536 RepID=A0ACC2J3R6_9PEZI|nr:hypothetical protein ONZ43_g1713 [Nemania bipapillata]